MFSIIWWALPGNRFLKFLQLLLVLLLIVMVCFWWLFPWLVDYLQLGQNTVSKALGPQL